MAGKNKKTESDFIKELEALEQQKKEATEQLKAYLKSQTDKLGQIYFELKKLENPDLSIDELVVETQNKVKEVKKEIKQRKAEEKERMLRRLIKKRIMTLKNRVKTTRENGWLALRLKASATGRGLKAYRMVSLQHHLC
ncbi:hypothetical protein V6U66_02340 [Streptococcus salivarius]|uniref:hypothetical protein n=1 Tax=Streptococcus salivarius TaxID=1304 RepID=UPI00397B7A26